MIYYAIHPPDVLFDPPEPEPVECGDCGELTSGTSICGPCADARFRDPVGADLLETCDVR